MHSSAVRLFMRFFILKHQQQRKNRCKIVYDISCISDNLYGSLSIKNNAQPKCINIITAFLLHTKRTRNAQKAISCSQNSTDGADENYTHNIFGAAVVVHVHRIYVSGLLASKFAVTCSGSLVFVYQRNMFASFSTGDRIDVSSHRCISPQRNRLSKFKKKSVFDCLLVPCITHRASIFPYFPTLSALARSLIYCIRTIMQINPQFRVIGITWRYAPRTEDDTQTKRKKNHPIYWPKHNTHTRYSDDEKKTALPRRNVCEPFHLCRNTPMLFTYTWRSSVSSTQTICPFICKSIRIILRYSAYD